MLNKNKRGMLLKEMLGIIIAVIGLGILFYLAISYFGIFRDDKKMKQAESALEEITAGINYINSNGGEKEVIILSPSDWYVIPFPRAYIHNRGMIDNKIPNTCRNKCLCICKDNKIESCEKEGVCVEVEKQIVLKSSSDREEASFTIKGGRSVNISKINVEGIDYIVIKEIVI